MKPLAFLLAGLAPLAAHAAPAPAAKGAATNAPGLARVAPRGLQRGVAARLTLTGTNLASVTNVVISSSQFTSRINGVETNGALRVTVTAAADVPRAAYEISVQGPGGTSGRLKLHVDDLPQRDEAAASGNEAAPLPVSFWGALDSAADSDEFSFTAQAGQSLVLLLAVKSLGSKLASPALTLLDDRGKVLAADTAFDGGDRFLSFRVAKDGRYTARVGDAMLGSGPDHFYRLSVGELPFVTGIFPLGLGTNTAGEIALAGFNLPAPATVRVTTAGPGEVEAPLDAEKLRALRAFKVVADAAAQFTETEPNDSPAQATSFAAPGVMHGRIGRAGDADLFRLAARAGQEWILETDAARRGTPLDTRLEVLDAAGRPVPRVLLQAVRNSAITFRGIDSVTPDCRVENWEEMELNEFLYLQGEVVRLLRAPQGPDSGFLFYSAGGKRRTYFDTSPTAHALDEPCFTVTPHAVGARLAPNGLPVFTVPYANDDDGERRLGTDSRVHFTAPADGAYVVRVTDTRAQGGERFAYRLIARAPRPDFSVNVSGADQTIPAGSGQGFSVTVDRVDGFDGDVTVTLSNLPPGFTATTPLVIQAGHTEAKGSLHAPREAMTNSQAKPSPIQLTATAVVAGRPVVKNAGTLGVPKVGPKPKLVVSLEPDAPDAVLATSRTGSVRAGHKRNRPAAPAQTGPKVLTIAPGQRIPALLKIHRQGHEDLVTFFVDNLPHGVIVDDIGLNGVLIPKGESERRIFLTCAKWVPEQERWCHAIEQQAGKQTSEPVLLRVRRGGS